MPKATCSVDGCDRDHYGHGWCVTHYKRWRKYGDPGDAYIASPGKFRPCSVAGCERRHYAHGWCELHYKRIRATGEPGPTALLCQPQEGNCSVEGCVREARSHGLCGRHHARLYRHGDPLAGGVNREHAAKGTVCSVEGCARPARSLGKWCKTHYGRYMAWGTVDAERPIRTGEKKPCAALGCTVDAKSKGFCSNHYALYKRHGDPLVRMRPYRTHAEPEGFCWCPQCQRSLPEDEFARKRTGRAAWCRSCSADRHVQRYYGITIEEFRARLAAQGGVCAICGEPETATLNGRVRRMTVDHDHACCPGPKSCGKCVRGLLCARCNATLGYLRDNPALADAMAVYLRSWARKSAVAA